MIKLMAIEGHGVSVLDRLAARDSGRRRRGQSARVGFLQLPHRRAVFEAGISRPYATRYHSYYAGATYKKHGGWHGRQTAHDLARYCGVAAKALGDRIKNWFTITHESSLCLHTFLSYFLGIHAPGEKVSKKQMYQLLHHALLGHGLSVDDRKDRVRAPRKFRSAWPRIRRISCR